MKPDDRLPMANAEALAINKIDLQKHLEDPNTITYSEAKEKITHFAKKYLKKTGRYSNLLVLGQNVAFDINFIKTYLFTSQEWDSLFSYNVEDTKSACLFLKRAGWFPKQIASLGSMVEYFGIPKHTAHEARGDVMMTIEVYKKMIELMRSKKDGGSSQDLISLLEAE
jgi:DNA polymerase III epsilon subunit-like protein